MEKHLLVTLADKNYVEQAKQLFSSVYFNAGWEGDYMLLSYDIPEKDFKWFRDKGILVKKVNPEYFKFKKERVSIISFKDMPTKVSHNHIIPWSVVSCKFFLFTSYFKRWRKVIYLDGDINVRAPINNLIKKKGFNAVGDYGHKKASLNGQFFSSNEDNHKLFDQLNQNYDLKSTPFNSGVMVFDTNIITKKTFCKFKKIFIKYAHLSAFHEQSLLNLCFHNKWNKLSHIYNLEPRDIKLSLEKINKVPAIIIHFLGGDYKPWDKKNPFYEEWKNNLKKADNINTIKKRVKNKKPIWNIKLYYFYLIIKRELKYILNNRNE